MTTQACIASCRQRDIARMIDRLERVGLAVGNSGDNLFLMCGIEERESNDSGLIMSPSGIFGWTIPQLMNLIALITTHGRPTPYNLTLRKVGGISQFKMRIMVPASADPFQIAGDLAAGHQCEIHELIEVK